MTTKTRAQQIEQIALDAMDPANHQWRPTESISGAPPYAPECVGDCDVEDCDGDCEEEPDDGDTYDDEPYPVVGTSTCPGLCDPQCDWCLVGHECPEQCGGGDECPYVALAKKRDNSACAWGHE